MPAHLEGSLASQAPATQMYNLQPGQRESGHPAASSQPYASSLGHQQSASFGGYPVGAPHSPSMSALHQQQSNALRRGHSYSQSSAMMAPPISTSFAQQQQGQSSPLFSGSPAGTPYSPLPPGHPPPSKRGSVSIQQSPQLAAPYSPNTAYYSPDLQPQQHRHSIQPQPNAMYSPKTPLSPLPPSSPAASVRSHVQSPSSAPQFRRVQDASELKPKVLSPSSSRRADPAGGFISVRPGSTHACSKLADSVCFHFIQPLKGATTNVLSTYHQVNPAFKAEPSQNPRRVLTKPSKPGGNNGHDNDDSDYILYVNDWLGSDEGNKSVSSFKTLPMQIRSPFFAQIPHPGLARARNIRTGRQMPEHED